MRVQSSEVRARLAAMPRFCCRTSRSSLLFPHQLLKTSSRRASTYRLVYRMLQARLNASTYLLRSLPSAALGRRTVVQAAAAAVRVIPSAAVAFSTSTRLRTTSKSVMSGARVDLNLFKSSMPRMSKSVQANETLAFVMRAMHHLGEAAADRA